MIVEVVSEIPVSAAQADPDLVPNGTLDGGWRITALEYFGMGFTKHTASVRAQLHTKLDAHPFQILADTPTPPLLFGGDWEIRIAKEPGDPEVTPDG